MISVDVDFYSVQFINLCREHKVERLYAFGSVINGDFDSESDIDLLAEIREEDPLERGDLLLQFWNALEQYFGRKVDLLTPNSLRNPYLADRINRTKKLVYIG